MLQPSKHTTRRTNNLYERLLLQVFIESSQDHVGMGNLTCGVGLALHSTEARCTGTHVTATRVHRAGSPILAWIRRAYILVIVDMFVTWTTRKQRGRWEVSPYACYPCLAISILSFIAKDSLLIYGRIKGICAGNGQRNPLGSQTAHQRKYYGRLEKKARWVAIIITRYKVVPVVLFEMSDRARMNGSW